MLAGWVQLLAKGELLIKMRKKRLTKCVLNISPSEDAHKPREVEVKIYQNTFSPFQKSAPRLNMLYQCVSFISLC